jgi:CheY-like chemotaxis protein
MDIHQPSWRGEATRFQTAMTQSLIPETTANEKRRILLITEEPSLRSLISTFVLTMGCACTAVSSADVATILEREAFDAVLLDADYSEIALETVLLMTEESRPSLLTRILVIRSGLTAPQTIELIERHQLRQVSQENLLQQLWAVLQDIFTSPQRSKLAPSNKHTAQMIFDSFSWPAPIGLRGSRTDSRQLAFQHGNAIIDLLIEPRGVGKISIMGQVLNSSKKRGESDSLPVLLVNGMRTIVRTSTNPFGEFRLECAPVRDACVEMRLRKGVWVSLPLGKLDWAMRERSD